MLETVAEGVQTSMSDSKEHCTRFLNQLLEIEDLFTILKKKPTDSSSELIDKLYSSYYLALDSALCMATDAYTAQQVQSFILDDSIANKEWIIDYFYQKLNSKRRVHYVLN